MRARGNQRCHPSGVVGPGIIVEVTDNGGAWREATAGASSARLYDQETPVGVWVFAGPPDYPEYHKGTITLVKSDPGKETTFRYSPADGMTAAIQHEEFGKRI